MSETHNRDSRSDCKEWLGYHGFTTNPFQSNAISAESDDVLKKHQDTVFVRIPYYESIKGEPNNPGYSVIFAEIGGGKTATCQAIKKHYDDLLGKENQPQVLTVIYDSFIDLPGY